LGRASDSKARHPAGQLQRLLFSRSVARCAKDEDSGLEAEVTAGSYRVELGNADIPVAVRIVFADEPAVRWKASLAASFSARNDHEASPGSRGLKVASNPPSWLHPRRS